MGGAIMSLDVAPIMMKKKDKNICTVSIQRVLPLEL
jgi:hypothetical protein